MHEPMLSRDVVAAVVTWRGRIGLFKRSAAVASDAGQWHCITGYLEHGEAPVQGALRELFEETGLKLIDLEGFEEGPVLELLDDGGEQWRVHTFHAATDRRRLILNWEHESYRWVEQSRLRRFDGQVAWLHHVTEGLALC